MKCLPVDISRKISYDSAASLAVEQESSGQFPYNSFPVIACPQWQSYKQHQQICCNINLQMIC